MAKSARPGGKEVEKKQAGKAPGASGLVAACAAPLGVPCDVWGNARHILDCMARAHKAKADLLVLPRLCLTGVTCGDMLRNHLLLEEAWKALEHIAGQSGDTLTCVGLPVFMDEDVYEVLAFVRGGVVEALVPYFIPCPPLRPWQAADAIQYRGIKCSPDITLPGKGWQAMVVQPGRDKELYLDDAQPLYIQPEAAPFTAGGGGAFLHRVAEQSKALAGPLAVAQPGAAESTTDGVYAGMCALVCRGKVLDFSPAFEEEPFIKANVASARGVAYAGRPCAADACFPWLQGDEEQFFQDCLDIAVHGLSTRLKRANIHNMVLGLSGGLDSAMALLIMEEARQRLRLPPQSLHVYSLPGPGTSKRTLNNARLLCQALGISLKEISIQQAVEKHLKDIGHGGQLDAAFENAQARERTQVLMDIANMVGGLVVGPGDMSELALGFTTYGGDHLSMYGVNSGMPKTLIRQMVDWYAEMYEGDLGDALQQVLKTPISPELLPGGQQKQKTEDILGPYPLTDFYLWHFLRVGLSPRALLQKARDAFGAEYTPRQTLHSLHSFFRRFFAAQFKRSCLPDGPQVLPISLSPRGGLRLPSDAGNKLWLDEIEQIMKEEQS